MSNPNFQKISLFVTGLVLFIGLSSCTDHRVQTKFFTQGSCEECKTYIESALKGKRGISEVEWDFSTSLTSVVFDTSKTSESTIQQELAKAGFSTMYFEADTHAQRDLPDCCKELSRRNLVPKGIPGH